MRTLWDREMTAEIALLGEISPARRLKLVSEVIESTIASLSDATQELLAGEAGVTVGAAVRSIHAALDGSGDGDSGDELYDELLELSEDFRRHAVVVTLHGSLALCCGKSPQDRGCYHRRGAVVALRRSSGLCGPA